MCFTLLLCYRIKSIWWYRPCCRKKGRFQAPGTLEDIRENVHIGRTSNMSCSGFECWCKYPNPTVSSGIPEVNTIILQYLIAVSKSNYCFSPCQCHYLPPHILFLSLWNFSHPLFFQSLFTFLSFTFPLFFLSVFTFLFITFPLLFPPIQISLWLPRAYPSREYGESGL